MNIVYYPLGDRNVASSRLRVWKIAEYRNWFTKHNAVAAFDTMQHLTYFGNFDQVDVVVIQKRPDLHLTAEPFTRFIYDVDDYIKGLPVHRADVITTDTPAKLELYPQAVVIPDCLDVDDTSVYKTEHAKELHSVIACVNAENVYHLKNVALACHQLHLELTVITNVGDASALDTIYSYGISGVQWQAYNVDAEMMKHDVAVCPFVFDGAFSPEWVKSKSANKLLKAWGLGLPVVGTPIQSYLDAGLHYKAETVDEWCLCFESLWYDKARTEDAKRGREIALQYTADKIAPKWLGVFKG